MTLKKITFAVLSNDKLISPSIWTRLFCFQFLHKNICIAGLWKYFFVENEDKRDRPNGGIIILSLLCILFFANTISAQRVWSLEKCIQHVQQNNTTTMRSANLEIEKNKILQQRAEAQTKPDLGFGTNLGFNFGRSVDPSTNAFSTATTLYNNFSLESNYTLYDGNRTDKQIKKTKLDVKAAEADANQMSKDVSLEVLRAYLRILMAEEQLANTKKNLAQTESWFRQTKNLVQAGLQSQADLRNVEIQKARDEQNIIEYQNFLDQSYVALKLILEIDPSLSLKVEKPKNIPEPSNTLKSLSFKSTYSKALKSQPGVEGGELSLQSLKLEEEITRTGKAPQVSLFGGLYTNYSSGIVDGSNPDFSNATTEEIDPVPVIIPAIDPNDPVDVTFFRQDGVIYPNIPYFKQLGNNIGVGVGVNLYVPILDQRATELNGEIARINFLQKQEENLRFKQKLRTDIQNAIADVKAAAAKLAATEKTFQLLEKQTSSMRNNLNMGNINAFEFATLLNQKDTAEIELVIAKYEFLLKKMVVEFYEGKALTLK